jgi:hypothetical protein
MTQIISPTTLATLDRLSLRSHVTTPAKIDSVGEWQNGQEKRPFTGNTIMHKVQGQRKTIEGAPLLPEIPFANRVKI